MDIGILDDVLDTHIADYDRVLSGIMICLSEYERRSTELINFIAACSSLAEAELYFDKLYQIQGKLSGLVFSRNINVGSSLTSLTKEFYRLYDPYVRDY